MSTSTHPGEILLEEFIIPLGTTQNALAAAIHIPPRRINEIVHGKRGITVDAALRLSRALGTTPEFWLDLQSHFDLVAAKDRLEGQDKINLLRQVTV
ncbi:HigA family addiction module antitoxin [Okibacterium fritillariae]|uniref:Addiction module antidote protein, HigA family n=1 Tax=Okibacterium fritillariae TaxID=123320 RepID=A0A1T5J0F2_9MICO|nr:HigA family addiction module antitoxin [Okibacterium fritillariae]SKC44927.1 addiction module antidote protein, HigA family [Okibacterium fritillariae]